MNKFTKRVDTALRVYRQGGYKAVLHRGKYVLGNLFDNTHEVASLVRVEDAIAVDPFTYKAPKHIGRKGPYTFNWILCPPGPGSGGHTTMFRFISYLESQGHTCRLYIYSSTNEQAAVELTDILKNYFKTMKAELIMWDGTMLPADAIVATGWETTYPAARVQSDAKRFYFVQDFEPFFYPVGSESTLAENSYRFGFHGITAGKWLATKLHEEFGMDCDNFDFGSDPTQYKFENKNHRTKVLFYARPVTARRGFEIGVMALELFHRMHPEYEINLVGWDVSAYKLPFPHVSHGVVSPDRLSDLYNECAVGLILSLTNMSLLPLELISSGCVPVVNDAANNRLVSNNPFIAYSHSTPKALAAMMSSLVSRSDLPSYAADASASVRALSWDDSTKKVEAIFKRELS